MIEADIGQLREIFSYDPTTGLIYQRHSNRNGFDLTRPVGSIDLGYLRIQFGRGKRLMAHRLAWALYHGAWPLDQIDHKDRNKLNNRIDNLRLATNSQNNVNVPIRGKVFAKGVCWETKRGKYKAQIKIHGSNKSLGYFGTVDEAAHAYNKAAIKYFGDFALLNPIGQDK